MDKKYKISKKLKDAWKDKNSGFHSVTRKEKLHNATKNNMRIGSDLRNRQIESVKQKWKDPNSKYNSIDYKNKMSECSKIKHIKEIDTDNLCNYGCGNKAKYIFGNGRYCCEKNWQSCPSKKSESRELILKELKKPNSWFKSKECSDSRRKRMLDGGAIIIRESQNIISKPQKKLFELVCKICPYVILEYPCLNYSIDIAIPCLNLAIEYDGSFYHNNNNISYDLNRQKRLEKEGWNFIRYIDHIPDFSDLYKKIMESINNGPN